MTGAAVHVDDLCDAAGTAVAGGGASAGAVTLLVPTRDVLLTRTDLRARRAADLRDALPYALEDRLAEPVDALYFAAAGRRDDAGLAAAVVRRERMAQWLALARDRGLDLCAAVPDALALPFDPDGWSVLAHGDAVLVRTGPAAGFAVPAGQLGLLLVWRLRECEQSGAALPRRLRLWRTADAAVTRQQLAQMFDGEIVEEAVIDHPRDLWETAPIPPIDLLGETYRDSAPQNCSALRWIPALVLFGLALIVHSTLIISRTTAFEQRAEQARTQALERFRQAFPEATRIVDMRVQAEQLLGAALGGEGDRPAGFALLLSEVGSILAGRGGVETTVVAYREGQLELKLVAPSLVVLEGIRSDLERRGLAARIASAETLGEGRLEGQIRIQGGAP